MVHTTQPPRALIGGQPTKIQSKMTLRPKAATPVNRSRSLVQVGPLSQFSGLQLRNRDGEEIDGEIVETVSDFILGGSKITADGDCSHEIKINFICSDFGAQKNKV